MKMTVDGGVNEILNIKEKSIYEVSKKLSRGMLMGARGNSGVILSQLFRGIYKGFEGFFTVNAINLAKAFLCGVEQAYKAVLKPVEGTILTVARESSEKLVSIASSRMSINEFFDEYIMEAKASLERTPDLLPVLKEAGVVDSGGAGFICILEGMQKALNGEFISGKVVQETLHVASKLVVSNPTDVEFGYCTEFILELKADKVDIASFNEKAIIDDITSLGNSIVVVKDEEIVKVHIHTLTPGEVLNLGQKYGEFANLKIENMTYQHNQLNNIQHVAEGECPCGEEHIKKPVKPEKRKKYAIVTVAVGEGLIKTFTEMGADYVVSGGQSMNPSTEDFIRGFETINADNIIVFPNNKNIILAAEQAAKIYEESKVWIVPSKTLAQGFSALTMLDLNSEPEEIVEEMKQVMDNVITGQITYAVRDTKVSGLNIKKDDFIGLVNSDIVASSRRRMEVFKKILEKSVDDDKEIITLIYGADVTKNEVIEGNQEVYSYILAIE
jgi:DAK2 domain fusion protein YloV